MLAQSKVSVTLLGQSNAVVADLGVFAAGNYQLRTCCRTDATGNPAVLVVAVLVNNSVVTTTPLYAAADTATSTYPTVYAQYDGLCTFSLPVASDITVQWSNPGTYHSAGKTLWIKGLQLQRTS